MDLRVYSLLDRYLQVLTHNISKSKVSQTSPTCSKPHKVDKSVKKEPVKGNTSCQGGAKVLQRS